MPDLKLGNNSVTTVKIGSTQVNKVYLGTNLIWSSVDPDAQAFITAAGITDATQQSAINTLVTDLKGYGIWTKMKAIYPFCGGSASSHKWNLRDPRDLNAAFRLVFYGGWTHSSNGAKAGVNGYADTYFNPVAQSTSLDSLTLSVYNRETLSGGFTPIFGNGQTTSPQNYTTLVFANKEAGGIASKANWSPSGNNPTYVGLKTITCNGSRVANFYKNGSIVAGSNTMAGSYQNSTFYLSAINNGTTAYLGAQAQVAFTMIADGFSANDVSNFYTAVQAYQTTLSRNV